MINPKIRFKKSDDSDYQDYKKVKLSDVCKHQKTGTLTTEELIEDGKYVVVNGGREFYGRYDKSNNDGDTITVSARGEAGHVKYMSEPFWAGGLCYAYHSFSDNTKCIAYSMMYHESNIRRQFLQQNSIPAVNKSDLDTFVFAIPTDIEEQTKIANFLSEIDNLIVSAEHEVESTKQLKKAMLQKMFPKNGEKVPEIRFPEFTDDWEQRKLGYLAEIKDSARIPNAEWSDFGVPYIRASDITNEDASGVLFISQERYEFYKNKTGAPTKGDVLFNGGGEIGKTMLNSSDSPIYVQGGAVLYARTSASDSLEGKYLKTYFETPNAQHYFETASAGGTMKHFTLKPSQEMPIKLPQMEEQQKIGEYFSGLDNLITLHQRKCDAYKKFKKAMMQKMFV